MGRKSKRGREGGFFLNLVTKKPLSLNLSTWYFPKAHHVGSLKFYIAKKY